MKKIHTVCRVVQAQLGGSYVHPVKAYDDPKVAEDAMVKSGEFFSGIADGTVLVKTPQGPRAVMTVKQLLHELGIASIGHRILEQDVHGALIVAPSAAIIQ